MITSSIVVYAAKENIGKENDLKTIIKCISLSIIDKLYVIDNSPTNILEKKIVSQSDKVIYIHNRKNVGYGAGHNVALRKILDSGVEYHIVLNSDILFNEEIISKIKNFMDGNSDVGQLLPNVIYPNGQLQYLCKLIPTPFDLIVKRFLPYKMTKKKLGKFELRFTRYNRLMNVPYLSGCFMFFRVSAIKEVGLFDERFFLYPEDIDLTRRMHKYYKTMFFPEVTIIHKHGAESYKSKKLLMVHIYNIIKYFNKWGWIFDHERKVVNKKVLEEVGYYK